MSAEKYTDFHRERMGAHLYPNEFLIRTLLGRYPGLEMSRDYAGRRLLDVGFGDGRNLPLFRNLGVEIFGVEPDPDVCRLVTERVAPAGIDCTLRAGSNTQIPFDDGFFDYVVASSSVYYVRENETFSDNLAEVARVMRST
jgi:SAM-dependent methyltransferase